MKVDIRIYLLTVGITFLVSTMIAKYTIEPTPDTPQVKGETVCVSDNITLSKERLLDDINIQRLDNGAGPLLLSEKLNESAQMKASHMLALDYWDHVSPSGIEPWDFFYLVGYDYRQAGENLASGICGEQRLVDAWMNSPKHRSVLLNPSFEELGIGVDGSFVVTHYGVSKGIIPDFKVQSRKEVTQN